MISVGYSGVAPSDGFLMVHRDDSAYNTFNIYVNGRRVGYGTGDGSYGGSTHLYTIPISKGATWSISGGGINSIAFIPLK